MIERIRELERENAALRSALTEADNRLAEASRMRANGGFVGDNIDRWLTTVDMMTRPLARAALTPSGDAR